MLKLRHDLINAEEQLLDLKRKLSEAGIDLSAARKELATAKSDCLYSFRLNSSQLLIS
jgi:hypothetical protein